MIVVDTNVLSELAKRRPDPRVIRWFERVRQTDLYITAVTVAEMLIGANRMDHTADAETKAEVILEILARYHRRTLAFDTVAAAECASITSLRSAAGRPIALADAMIAATAIATEADAIATRDKDFADVGIPVLNPWSG
ncbi:PIN domain-containing protein [Leifsonia sp. 22587]|uniref:PIN domain-containing protein n=1 Tax=Leifsonia sp. 22587 TaxID=3453946 RepID=UPI003F83366A